MNKAKYSKKLLLCLSKKQYDLLRKIKGETGIPISEMIRRAIDTYIETHLGGMKDG